MTKEQDIQTEKTRSQESYCCGNASTEDKEDTQLDKLSEENKIRKFVRNEYGTIASGNQGVPNLDPTISAESNYTDYTKEELETIPKQANLGLGSGNPVRLANIQSGEVVVDLGSGAGIDCFLASQQVGATGKVIGIDMTPQMIDQARENAIKNNYKNVEFRLGEIEHLPVANESVDVIVSNCVINLSVNKNQVFREAFRILKPGGRLVVSDILLAHDFPEVVKEALQDVPGCVSRAWVEDEYLKSIRAAGFNDVKVLESQVIKPQKRTSEGSQSDTRKRKMVLSGKSIEVELTAEEDEVLTTAIMKGHIQAYKPKN